MKLLIRMNPIDFSYNTTSANPLYYLQIYLIACLKMWFKKNKL